MDTAGIRDKSSIHHMNYDTRDTAVSGHFLGGMTVSSYRGFIRKGARVRIITFRDTTRLQSKSNRYI